MRSSLNTCPATTDKKRMFSYILASSLLPNGIPPPTVNYDALVCIIAYQQYVPHTSTHQPATVGAAPLASIHQSCFVVFAVIGVCDT